MMRLGLLPTAYIHPRQQRPLRDLLGRRMLLVRPSVRLLRSVQGYWARSTGQRLSANAFRKPTAQQLETAFVDPSEVLGAINRVGSASCQILKGDGGGASNQNTPGAGGTGNDGSLSPDTGEEFACLVTGLAKWWPLCSRSCEIV